MDEIDFSFNFLTELDPNLFETSLTTLSFNHNPIIIRERGPLLNLPDLQILNLEGCNITNVHERTFLNLSGLISLNMANNLLDEVFYYKKKKSI